MADCTQLPELKSITVKKKRRKLTVHVFKDA